VSCERCKELESQVERLRAALQFYADMGGGINRVAREALLHVDEMLAGPLATPPPEGWPKYGAVKCGCAIKGWPEHTPSCPNHRAADETKAAPGITDVLTLQAKANEWVATAPTFKSCAHEWVGHKSWVDSSGPHGSKRCALCSQYVQW
jgi:hypothetical protein